MHTPRLLLATLAGLSCIFASTPRAGAQSPCDADITVDGVVDGEDLAALLGSWGVCQGPGVCIADLNSDGVVDGADLTALLDGWGCTGTVLAPTVQSFSPAKAPWFGGGQITITGTNLLGATEVLIGDQVCPSVTVLSATTVTAVVPPYEGGAGSVLPALFPISVVTPGGTAVAPVLFTFVEPSVTALPQFGPYDQPTQVTISASLGEFLTGVAASVYVEGPDQYATDVVVVDAQTITAVLPPNRGGPAAVSLVVEQGAGKTQASWRGTNAFSYASLRYTVLDQLPDPTVITDASLRSAIIATGQPWRVQDDVSQLEFVLIPPGSYTMGCTDPDAGCSATGGFNESNPPHPVTLTYPFYMARCEVSIEQFEAVSSQPVSGQIWNNSTPVEWRPHLPLSNIQWQDCKDWFLTPAKLRFANEAEWQYACKGGATLLFSGTASPTVSSCGNTVEGYPNGVSAGESPIVYSELDCASEDRVITGWNDLNSAFPGSPTPNSWSARPIGICPVSAPGVTSVANPLGLYDMQGNVQEWVEDWYTISTSSHAGWYATMPSVDPGPSPIQSPTYEGQKLQCGGAVRPDYNVGKNESPVGSWVRNNSPINNQSAVLWYSFLNTNQNENWNGWVVGIRAVMDVQYPPSIQSVSPNAADASGGTTITVTGANLAGSIMGPTISVYIGDAAATNIVVVDQNTITATVPPGVVGFTTVQVVNDVGVAKADFAYLEIPSWAQVVEAAPDPAIVTDASVRAAIEATGHPWHVQDIATGIEMMLVPAGTYEMGCTPSDAHACFTSESPVHSVTISQPTYVGRYEVTQAQWTAVMGSNPSQFTAANGFPGSDARPVESVSWTTVQGFLSATNMRLPTEAEWEYACRAGTTTAFHGWPVQPAGTNDDTQVGNIAWYGLNAPGGTTQPVGALLPNGFGLYDMAGNVSEWCSDWYSDTAYGSKPVVDPQGPASSPQQWRVVRGSNILLGAQAGPNYARSSCRDANSPDLGAGSEGFRVVRNP
jgi:formylglycine-generating enzyme required for sulfatase activity